MRYLSIFVLLAFPVLAFGQYMVNADEKYYSVNDGFRFKLVENNNAYASAVVGNGFAYGEGVAGDRSMEGRTFEFRFGKEISISSLPGEKFRVDLIHFNEGHPDNNHRDGFAGQLVYRKPFNHKVNIEVGAGPYFSMNTTTVNGAEINDAKLGALFSLAALVNIDQYSPGLHMRFALNYVSMPEVHSSVAMLVGIGKDFDSVPARVWSESGGNPIWLGVNAGVSQTNHRGIECVPGFGVEAKKYFGDQWAGSISGIWEGDDEVRVNRRGVAVQGWFTQPLSEKWAASAGAGPYVAFNSWGSGDPQLHGLITFQVERLIAEKWKGIASFSRVITFTEENDRDLFRFGIMKQFDI